MGLQLNQSILLIKRRVISFEIGSYLLFGCSAWTPSFKPTPEPSLYCAHCFWTNEPAFSCAASFYRRRSVSKWVKSYLNSD
jgi:hypothetical protein